MKVKELLEKLKTFNPESEIWVEDEYECGFWSPEKLVSACSWKKMELEGIKVGYENDRKKNPELIAQINDDEKACLDCLEKDYENISPSDVILTTISEWNDKNEYSNN